MVLPADRFAYEHGTFRVPVAPGLGVRLEPSKLVQYATDHIVDPYLDKERAGWFAEKPA